MAPAYYINKPDVLATLPRPLDHSKGQFHAGEVYTQQPGSKKRKRLEVIVGVDGEAANIYHIPSSDLRTSYPIPPQESFTCPPYSIRYQRPKATGREQYTYLSTKDTSGFKVTLCRDSVDRTGKTTSTTHSRRLQHKSPVERLSTSCCAATSSDETEAERSGQADVLAVCRDGQVLCLDGVDLSEKWSVSAHSLCKDALHSSASSFQVDDVFFASATDMLKGIFGGRQEAFGAFGREVDSETFNPDVLALIITPDGQSASRYLLLLGAITGHDSVRASQQSLAQLLVSPLPHHRGLAAAGPQRYQLHVRSGKLLELSDNIMRTYDLTSTVPKLRDTVILPDGSTSFAQLSEHSVLSISPSSLAITNVTYRSVQAQATLSTSAADGQDTANGLGSGHGPVLLTYLSKLDLAIAMSNNTLLSIQIQRQKNLSHEGLLIDAIGHGLSKADYLPETVDHQHKPPFNKLLPGTLSDSYVKQSLVEVEALDNALSEGELKEFEGLLAAKFGVTIASQKQITNGVTPEEHAPATPDWEWEKSASRYPHVDRRWVLYAISRIFSMDLKSDLDGSRPSLSCVLPESNVLVYLVVAGHLTLPNVVAAFRNELSETDISTETIADELVQQLIEVDPALELLMSYLSATKVSEMELLLVVRTVMQSLDQQPRLTLPTSNGTQDEDSVAMEIDQLERELELAEYHLGDDSNVRARLLTTAFERLAGYSSVATVRGLRKTFNPTEILSLIHLLRVQLVGSAWTTRYSELTTFDQDETAKTLPDGAIALIAELLARCIDAVGTNGWLADRPAGNQIDGGHFLTALKLEVSAALEGLNDAVALNGLLGEAVRYGSASLFSTAGRRQSRSGDRPRPVDIAASSQLPPGLMPKQAVSHYKVGTGGEVLERSARERGHLLSQRVKEYSLERIAI